MASPGRQRANRKAEIDHRFHELVTDYLAVSVGWRKYDSSCFRWLQNFLDDFRRVFHGENKMIFRVIAIIGSLACLSLGSWIAWMSLDNVPPFRYLGAEYGSKIIPDPVHANSMVSSDWFLSNVTRDCPRDVNRIFSDFDTGKIVTTLDATPINRTISTDVDHRHESGFERFSRSFLLPPRLPARTGYHVETCFYCNILQFAFPPARICIKSPVLLVNVVTE